jgi:hypothetical protein
VVATPDHDSVPTPFQDPTPEDEFIDTDPPSIA